MNTEGIIMNTNKGILGILLIVAIIASTGMATALQDPYPLNGYIVDKAGNELNAANIIFTNINTDEIIYFDSYSDGYYVVDCGYFTSGYSNGDNIAYSVNYSGTDYVNSSYYHILDVSEGSHKANITLNQAPSIPTSFTDLGTNLIDHTPSISWTKGTDGDSGDTVTTYIYVGTTTAPTTEEGYNTGTTIDLGSTITLVDGTTYYYRLRSYDGERWSVYTTADEFRMNSEPTVSSVTIAPVTAYTDTGLTGSGTYDDAESDTESGTTYKWFKNDAEIDGQTTTSLASNQFVKGDEIIFLYTPNDGYETGTPVNSSVKTISDSIPTTPTGSSIDGTTKYVGDLLTVTGAGSTDGDSDPVTYQYEFRQTSASGTVVQALSSTNTYTLQTTDAHTTIYVNVYGRADNVNSVTYESINRIVTNSIPVLTSIGAKNVDDMVQITVDEDATDGDSDTQTYSCNRTDLFTDFSTSTGLGHFTPFYSQTGVYYVDFGTSDGYGGIDNETITITVSDVTFDTSLYSGWNLLAWTAGINGSASEFTDIVSDAQYAASKNVTSGTFDIFDPSAPSYYNFTTITGKGYYVQTTSTTPMSRSVIDAVEYDTTLLSGWSIFGWTDATPRTAEYVSNSVGENCQYVATKNVTSGNFDIFDPDAPSHNNFDVITGIGYYVKATPETVWTRSA